MEYLTFARVKLHVQVRSQCWGDSIRITCPCDLYPLAPHFYIVKLGFTGVYIFSYFCTKTALTCTHDLCFEQK